MRGPFYRCRECGKRCGVDEEHVTDWDPYGERVVERKSVIEFSTCCGADFEEVSNDE